MLCYVACTSSIYHQSLNITFTSRNTRRPWKIKQRKERLWNTDTDVMSFFICKFCFWNFCGRSAKISQSQTVLISVLTVSDEGWSSLNRLSNLFGLKARHTTVTAFTTSIRVYNQKLDEFKRKNQFNKFKWHYFDFNSICSSPNSHTFSMWPTRRHNSLQLKSIYSFHFPNIMKIPFHLQIVWTEC